MKSVLITTRDQKAVTYGQVVTAPNIPIALRSWEQQLNDPRHADADQAKWPGDFTLWHIGEYDHDTGEITPCKPVQLAVASDLVRRETADR